MRKDTAGIAHRFGVVITLNNVHFKRRIDLENIVCRHMNHIELDASRPIVDINPRESAFSQILRGGCEQGLNVKQRFSRTEICCTPQCDDKSLTRHQSPAHMLMDQGSVRFRPEFADNLLTMTGGRPSVQIPCHLHNEPPALEVCTASIHDRSLLNLPCQAPIENHVTVLNDGLPRHVSLLSVSIWHGEASTIEFVATSVSVGHSTWQLASFHSRLVLSHRDENRGRSLAKVRSLEIPAASALAIDWSLVQASPAWTIRQDNLMATSFVAVPGQDSRRSTSLSVSLAV